MFCKKCGVQIAEGATFCRKCGNAVDGGQEQKGVPEPAVEAAEEQSAAVETPAVQGDKKTSVKAKTGKKTAMIILIPVIAIMLIAGVFFGWKYISRQNALKAEKQRVTRLYDKSLEYINTGLQTKEKLKKLYTELEEYNSIDIDFRDGIKELGEASKALQVNFEGLHADDKDVNFASAMATVWQERQSIIDKLTTDINGQSYSNISALDQQRIDMDRKEAARIDILIEKMKSLGLDASKLEELKKKSAELNLPENKSFLIIKNDIQRNFGITREDLGISVHGNRLVLWDSESNIPAVMGTVLKASAVYDDFSGVTVNKYENSDISISTVAGQFNWNSISSILLYTDKYRTSRGARVGDTEARIIELYGTPINRAADYLVYTPTDDQFVAIKFEMALGKVSMIRIFIAD